MRVEDAHPAIVSKRQFQRAKKLLGSRAPKKVHPRRSASPYLLSGLLRCETCGKAMTAAEAKSGKYTYYVCHSLLKRGSGTCKTPRLNAKSFEALIVDELRANVLTESNIRDLVKLLDEEMDGVAHEQRERLQTIDGELEDVKKQLSRVWHFVARSDSVDVAEASDLIVELRERKEKLEVAAEEARGLLSERRQFLDSADTIAIFAAEMSDVPQDQRADRDQGLRPLLRQGDRGQARQGRHRLLHTHAGGQSHRGSGRRRDRPHRASSQFGTVMVDCAGLELRLSRNSEVCSTSYAAVSRVPLPRST